MKIICINNDHYEWFTMGKIYNAEYRDSNESIHVIDDANTGMTLPIDNYLFITVKEKRNTVLKELLQ
jgi:hypothetical protein